MVDGGAVTPQSGCTAGTALACWEAGRTRERWGEEMQAFRKMAEEGS